MLKIVYYHTISDVLLDYFPQETTQSIDTFNRQIRHLNKRFNIISLEEALHIHQNKERFSNSLVITTDDGFKENYTTIAPVLNDLNLSFTALLCNDFIDNKSLMWRNVLFYIKSKCSVSDIEKVINRACTEFQIDRPLGQEGLMVWSLKSWPYKLKDALAQYFWDNLIDVQLNDFLSEKKPYLTSEQVLELVNNGFSIGSHSRSHPYFKMMDDNEIELETIVAANELEKRFNTQISAFSFPFERPVNSPDQTKIEKILSSRFNVILGTRDKGLNHSIPAFHWERLSMEFEYAFSIFNLQFSPLKQRYLKN
ncbi:MAG: peptidoglycan/xylan/chitin deacetylase (PgdA/CDA1 family) [Bacteroidia bacterium]|jgi:peptidoglycan/xylan/chitin deacetylase (PgdA/CDA1 family)